MKILNIVMIVKNEERCLERCLNSIKGLADHIIITDTGSTDRTKVIAREFGAILYDYDWMDDFSDARNFGLRHSDADWNLILDADETLTGGTREDIEAFLDNTEQLGAVKIINAYRDGTEINHGVNYTTRLLPRGVFFEGRIHEQAASSLPRIPLPLIFEHDGYLLPQKEERNLPLLLSELEKDAENPYYLFQTASALRNLKRFKDTLPYFEAFLTVAPNTANYRCRGVTSYLYSLIELKAFKEGLELIQREQLTLSTHSDFWFACGIFYMKLVLSDTKTYLSYLPEIEGCYLRCLSIGENELNGGVTGTGSFKAAYNLGLYYELSGNSEKATTYYSLAADCGYEAAKNRLLQL